MDILYNGRTEGALTQALIANDGYVDSAAKELGMSEWSLYDAISSCPTLKENLKLIRKRRNSSTVQAGYRRHRKSIDNDERPDLALRAAAYMMDRYDEDGEAREGEGGEQQITVISRGGMSRRIDGEGA